MAASTKPDGTKALQAVADYFAALEAIDDPMERYDEATAAMERWRDVPEQLAAVREGALLEMAESEGMSLAEIGRLVGFTRGRAQALVARARARRAERTGRLGFELEAPQAMGSSGQAAASGRARANPR